MASPSLALVHRQVPAARLATAARPTPRPTPRPTAAARPAGFVLTVDVGPEAFAAMPAEVLRVADTLRELVREWLPDARTRAVLATGSRAPGSASPHSDGSFRAILAAIPDAPRVQVDVRARQVTVDGEEVRLTPKELDLLVHLAGARGRVVTREELHTTVWRDRTVSGSSRTVDVHIRRLRANSGLSGLITTVRGVGYRLAPRPHLVVTD